MGILKKILQIIGVVLLIIVMIIVLILVLYFVFGIDTNIRTLIEKIFWYSMSCIGY